MKKVLGILGAIWGITGVMSLLGNAVRRLAPLAVTAFSYEFSWYHWLALSVILFFMSYMEGYQGFQKGFSPRVASRALYLKNNPRFLHVLFAPLFCMGFFHASRRRQITSISVTTGIVLLIIAVHFVVQPWRGIIDAGVLAGLAWGLISLIIFSFKAFTSKEFTYPPDVPEGNGQ